MSAPLKLTPSDVLRLANFLTAISAATQATGVIAGTYGPIDVAVGDSSLSVAYDSESHEYRIDDRNGD